MTAPAPLRIVRVLLALIVSLWMAGAGCLWGCSNGKVVAAEVSVAHGHDSSTVVSGSSCHSKPQAKPKGHERCAKTSANKTPEPTTTLLPVFNAIPEGLLKDCPLAVSAKALATKSSANAPNKGQSPVADFPNVEALIQRVDARSSPTQYLNRGPTYLRCCVFLI